MHGVRIGLGRVEHAGGVIDDAARTIAAHAAAAERVDGHEVLAEERVLDRIADVGCAVRCRGLEKFRFDLAEYALARHAGPLHLDVAIAENDAAAAIVVCHHEIGRGVVHRAAPGAEQETVELARLLAHRVDHAAVGVATEELRGDRERRGQDLGEARGQNALFDDHAVLEPPGAAQIDGTGDTRPRRLHARARRIANADGVHRQIAIVGEREDVAVAGEAFAEAIGEGEALFA